jgi:hypothetical protein
LAADLSWWLVFWATVVLLLVWFLLGRGMYIGPVLWIWNWYVVVVINI